MSAYSYNASNPREALKDAKVQLAALQKMQDQALTQSQQTVMYMIAENLPQKLWHMTDWIIKCAAPEYVALRARAGITDLGDFQKACRLACPDLELCWEATNGIKHFRQHPDAKITENTASAVAQAPIAMPSTLFDVGFADYVGGPKSISRPKTILKDGRNLRTADLCERAIAYWESFLAAHGL